MSDWSLVTSRSQRATLKVCLKSKKLNPIKKSKFYFEILRKKKK